MKSRRPKSDIIFESKDRLEVAVIDSRDSTREYYDILPEQMYKLEAITNTVNQRNEREGYNRWSISKTKVSGTPYTGKAYYIEGNSICYDCAIIHIQKLLVDAIEVDDGFELCDGTFIRRRNPLEVSKLFGVPLTEEICRLYEETDWPLLELGLPCDDCGRMMATPMKAAIMIAQNCRLKK